MSDAVVGLIGALFGALASSGTSYFLDQAKDRRANRAAKAEHARQARIAFRLVGQELRVLTLKVPSETEWWKLPTPAWDAWGGLLAAELPEEAFGPLASAYVSLKGGGMKGAVADNISRAADALERWNEAAAADGTGADRAAYQRSPAQ
jgi:hypothetical protein